MNETEAMAFLTANQPLPPRKELSAEVVETLDSVRRWLSDHPLPRALPLLLRVFGRGYGLGVYPMIEDTLARYPRETVIAELTSALMDAPDEARYWALQFAAVFPDTSMAKLISDLLPRLDYDSRYAALTALESIGGDEAIGYVSEW